MQDAKIAQQQIAACLALIISDAEDTVGVKSNNGHLPNEIIPNMIEHVSAGTEVTTVSPPNASESKDFVYELKNDIAAGVGLTYAQLTGDYSKFNFASGRMSKVDFFMALEHVQRLMFKPNLNIIFEWITGTYELKTGRDANFTPVWVFPARAAVNPMEELDVLVKKVRAGFLSPSAAAKQMGEHLETVIEQWTEDKEMWKDLVFDIDPTKFTSAGNQLNEDDAASSNNNQSDESQQKSNKKDGDK